MWLNISFYCLLYVLASVTSSSAISRSNMCLYHITCCCNRFLCILFYTLIGFAFRTEVKIIIETIGRNFIFLDLNVHITDNFYIFLAQEKSLSVRSRKKGANKKAGNTYLMVFVRAEGREFHMSKGLI